MELHSTPRERGGLTNKGDCDIIGAWRNPFTRNDLRALAPALLRHAPTSTHEHRRHFPYFVSRALYE